MEQLNRLNASNSEEYSSAAEGLNCKAGGMIPLDDEGFRRLKIRGYL
ncbi:MAG: hypothetical protein HOC20_13160 [Chloroflexi bacterium]|nr:hypothetical protein [Chloroflexota bacterium]